MTLPPSPNPLPTTEGTLQDDIRHDRAYLAGLRAGWNLGVVNANDEFNSRVNSLVSELTQASAPTTEGVTQICPAEYAHPFFVYDFMPQKIMFKSDRGDDTMALDVLSVRGWGHLIGHGQAGLKINHEVAAAIQDNFGKWVAKTLTDALISPVAEGVTQGWPVPDGWKLVPIEPDDNMICDGFECDEMTRVTDITIPKCEWPASCAECADLATAVYRAMIAAAPLPPEKTQGWQPIETDGDHAE